MNKPIRPFTRKVSGLFCCPKGDDFIPCPHFKITITKRSNRQSAVAGAAYQSGESLFSEYDQKQKAYTDKKGIAYTEIMLPTNAPPEYSDRANKYDLLKHPKYHLTSDADERNIFNIEKYLSHKLKVKPTDIVEIYDCTIEDTNEAAE